MVNVKSKKISLNKSSVDLGGQDFHPHSSHWMTEVGKYLSQDLHGSFMAAPLQPVVKNSRSHMRSIPGKMENWELAMLKKHEFLDKRGWDRTSEIIFGY